MTLGLHVLMISSYRTRKYPQNTSSLYTHTCLYLTLAFMCLHFNSGIFASMCIMKLWCRLENQGTRECAGLLFMDALSPVSSHHLHHQLLPK